MHKYWKQQGAVLVTGMIILVVMVILGVSAITFTALSEKMAGNQKDKEIALQAAESALREAENWLTLQLNTPIAVANCETPPCDVWIENFSAWQSKSHSWWMSVGRMFDGILEGVETQPYYIIEQHSFVPYELDPNARSKGKGYYHYQITTRGTGGDDTATAIVQSIYTVQYK